MLRIPSLAAGAIGGILSFLIIGDWKIALIAAIMVDLGAAMLHANNECVAQSSKTMVFSMAADSLRKALALQKEWLAVRTTMPALNLLPPALQVKVRSLDEDIDDEVAAILKMSPDKAALDSGVYWENLQNRTASLASDIKNASRL